MTCDIDPYATARAAGGYAGDFGGETIPVLVNYRDEREAAGDWARLSNAAPGRIRIPAEDDTRSLTQLPSDTEPPQQMAYKARVPEHFRRPRTDPTMNAAVEAVVARAFAVLRGLPADAAEDSIEAGSRSIDGPRHRHGFEDFRVILHRK